jgi:anti-sigma regulatory factor (Ser/Thr protein kinase)
MRQPGLRLSRPVTTVNLRIPPRSAYVGVVRLALAALARSADLNEDAVDDLKIAISEACANAVISNETAGTDEPVTISWAADRDKIIVEIGDRGRIYEGGSTPDSWDTGRTTPRITMSVALLSTLVDECEFIPRDGGGMLTRLVIER